MQGATWNQSSPIAPLFIIFVVMLLRMRRNSGVRPLSLVRLWIRPAIVGVVALLFLYYAPPHGLLQGLLLAAALGAGIAAGWRQGKMIDITVNPDSGKLQVKMSLIAQAIFMGLILVRMGLRPWLTGSDSPVHAYAALVTDAFILFFAGFASAQATEMFIRARALLKGPA